MTILSVLLERRTDDSDSKIVMAPDMGYADLRDWVLDNHRGYRIVESWPTPVAA